MDLSARQVHAHVTSPAYVNGRLQWDGVDLEQLAQAHGTPCHVGCRTALIESLDAFRAPFEARELPLQVRFSVKTNPVPVFLEALGAAGAGFEVLALHELELLRRLGLADSRVMVSSLRDAVPMARAAHALGATPLGVATPGQLAALLEAADGFERTQPVALSICPELARGRWDLSVNSGGAASPLGFRAGSRELGTAFEKIAGQPRLRLSCLHMHLGSGIGSGSPYARGLQVLEGVVRQAAAAGHSIDALDIGGGFGLASTPTLGAMKTLASLLGRAPAEPDATRRVSLLLDEVATLVRATFDRLDREGRRPVQLIAEPGRALSGPCQALLLRVIDVVDRGHGPAQVLCDGGAMAISPLLITEHHRVVPLIHSDGEQTRQVVLGSLPTALDRVSPSATLPPLSCGDFVAVLDTGAYFVSTNNTFAGPRPPYVWLGEAGPCLVRPRETLEQVFGL